MAQFSRLQDHLPRSRDLRLGLAPTELRGDIFQKAPRSHVRCNPLQVFRDCHQQSICSGNGLVRGEFFGQCIGLTDIGAAKDGARVRVDEADLIAVAFLLPE